MKRVGEVVKGEREVQDGNISLRNSRRDETLHLDLVALQSRGVINDRGGEGGGGGGGGGGSGYVWMLERAHTPSCLQGALVEKELCLFGK